MGVVSPDRRDRRRRFATALLAGASGVGPITLFDPADLPHAHRRRGRGLPTAAARPQDRLRRRGGPAGDRRGDERRPRPARRRRRESRHRARAVLDGRPGGGRAPGLRAARSARRAPDVPADAVRPVRPPDRAASRPAHAAADPRLGLRRRNRRHRRRLPPGRQRAPRLDAGGWHRLDDQPAGRRPASARIGATIDAPTTEPAARLAPVRPPARRLRARRGGGGARAGAARRGAARAARASTPRWSATATRSTPTASASRTPKGAAPARR